MGSISLLVFFLSISFALAIMCILHFYINCKISLLISSKDPARILIWIITNL